MYSYNSASPNNFNQKEKAFKNYIKEQYKMFYGRFKLSTPNNEIALNCRQMKIKHWIFITCSFICASVFVYESMQIVKARRLAKQSKNQVKRKCEFNRNLLSLIQIQFADTTEMHYPFMLRLQSIKSREMPVQINANANGYLAYLVLAHKIVLVMNVA